MFLFLRVGDSCCNAASVGASAKRGLLIKGGKYLELLARADVLLVDKTGTLTLGQPQVTDVIR